MAWDWDKLQQQKNARQGGSPPPVDDVIEKFKNFKGGFPGLWIVVALLVIIILGYSMAYTVDVDEVGVVQRFGKYDRTVQSGLNFKLPFVEKATKVKIRYVYKEEFGFKTLSAGVRSRYAADSGFLDESLMLTGDLNVAVVPWIVQFKVKDPYNFLFKVKDVKSTLRDLSESTMRLVVGDRSINEVISKREEIADQARDLLQKELDEAETGINVVTIEMKKTNVPTPVQPSFNEVNQAIQDKEKMIYEAKEAKNKIIPQAKGQAEKTIKAAEGYKTDRINRAKGDAARFNALYEEYLKAKDVTKRRLYLETLKEVYPKLGNKYIIDSEVNGLLPLLNLDQGLGSKGGAR